MAYYCCFCVAWNLDFLQKKFYNIKYYNGSTYAAAGL